MIGVSQLINAFRSPEFTVQYLVGGGGSNTLAFPLEAIKLSGDYDDTSGTKNFIQIVCTDDDGTPEFFYTISQEAT